MVEWNVEESSSIIHDETRPNQVETAVHGCNFWLSVETLVMSLSRQAFYVVISLASLLSDLWLIIFCKKSRKWEMAYDWYDLLQMPVYSNTRNHAKKTINACWNVFISSHFYQYLFRTLICHRLFQNKAKLPVFWQFVRPPHTLGVTGRAIENSRRDDQKVAAAA